jgi:hypothetical protein
MGEVLAVGLLVVAVPLTAVALRSGRRPLPVVELPLETPAMSVQDAYDTAYANSYASTSAR